MSGRRNKTSSVEIATGIGIFVLQSKPEFPQNWSVVQPKTATWCKYGEHIHGKISVNAHLSKIYTSHCIRPTVVTTMWNAGCNLQDIQVVTGHEREDSVKRYLKRVDDVKKEEYSRVLSHSFNESILSSETTNLTNKKRKFEDMPKFFDNCQFNCTFSIN